MSRTQSSKKSAVIPVESPSRALAGDSRPCSYRLDDGQCIGQAFDRPTRLRGLATRAIALGRQTLDRVPDRDLALES